MNNWTGITTHFLNGKQFLLLHADSAKEQIWQSKLALRWINEVVASFATMEGAEDFVKLSPLTFNLYSPCNLSWLVPATTLLNPA